MRSIKAKLIMLGAVSIVCTVILGLVGIYIMNSNNANNQVLNDINNINLKQNENTTQETSFLYDLDLNHYQTIQSNLAFMEEAAAGALTYSKGEPYDADLQSVAATITTVSGNTSELNKLLGERGFQSGSGMYANYVGGDEALADAISRMSGESGWVDGVWDSVLLGNVASQPIGGKNYKKTTYAHKLPEISKRDMLLVRMGGNGIEYTGDVYVTNIKLDSTALPLAEIDLEVLAASYGDGLAGVEVSAFDGMDALISELEDCVPAPGTVEEQVERRQLARVISVWLDGLEEGDRRLFVRRYWYGVPVKELAAERGEGANALSQRSELQTRIRQLEDRLDNNAQVQEGEQPAEDPMELLKELDGDYARLEELISAINRTNNSTRAGDGTTLSDLLAKRDCLKGKLSILRGFLNSASALVRRHSVSEIKIKSTVDVRKLQKQVDGLSKDLRELEETIQEKNWTTELL